MFISTNTYISSCGNLTNNSDVDTVAIGSIIHIDGVGFYIFSSLANQVVLIGLEGGNRWDEPIDVEPNVKYNISIIKKLVGNFNFKIVKKVTYSFE